MGQAYLQKLYDDIAKDRMMIADVLSGLVETDTDLLLAINGWRAEWADYFMYAFSGKWIWVPLYAAILYVIVRNLHWKSCHRLCHGYCADHCFADQVGATVIRPVVCRLRPANLENPVFGVRADSKRL